MINTKVFCKTIEEFKSIVKILGTIATDVSHVSDETILKSIHSTGGIIIIFREQDYVGWCEITCNKNRNCEFCNGYKEILATKFLREHKLERILNETY